VAYEQTNKAAKMYILEKRRADLLINAAAISSQRRYPTLVRELSSWNLQMYTVPCKTGCELGARGVLLLMQPQKFCLGPGEGGLNAVAKPLFHQPSKGLFKSLGLPLF
jgi:hypothetical protein